MKWIFRIEKLNQQHNDLVGKKCANLGEMAQMGMQVPSGFALTVNAYKDFMELTGAGEEIRKYLAGVKLESVKPLRRWTTMQPYACWRKVARANNGWKNTMNSSPDTDGGANVCMPMTRRPGWKNRLWP